MTGAPWIAIAFAYHLASRLAYVLYVGVALKRQERAGYFTRRHGAAEGFRRLRRPAAALMRGVAPPLAARCDLRRHTPLTDPPRRPVPPGAVGLGRPGQLH